MFVPTVHGVIERRILANYRVDPAVLQAQLPAPFRVQEFEGKGIAGICLIRLANVRPRFLPAFLGARSENAAHRIAVEWPTPDGVRSGVYIPRRDTSSFFNTLVGGRLFPGTHHRARFEVREADDEFFVQLDSRDDDTHMLIEARVAEELPPDSVFRTVDRASSFFGCGSIGYSATGRPGCFDCLELDSFEWHVQPLAVQRVESSWFDDTKVFPAGTAEFDSALLMRNVPHRWVVHETLRVGP